MQTPQPMSPAASPGPGLRLVIGHAVVALVWLLGAHRLLALWVEDAVLEEVLVALQAALFVLGSSLWWAWQWRRQAVGGSGSGSGLAAGRWPGRHWRPLALWWLAITVLTVVAMAASVRQHTLAEVVRLDMIATLRAEQARDALAEPGADPRALAARLAPWPVGQESGRVLLMQATGESWRQASGEPLADGLPAATALAEATAPLLQGRDAQGQPWRGVARPVGSGGWWVLAQVQSGSGPSPASLDLAWTALAGLAGLVLSGVLHWQRQQQRAWTALRRQAERQQRQAESLRVLQALADAVGDGVVAQDIDGRILLFNTAAQRLSGRDPSQVLGRDEHSVFPPTQAQALMQAGRDAVEQGVLHHRSLTLDTVQGPRAFDVVCGPLRDPGGAVFGRFGLWRDETEARRLHEELRQHRDHLETRVNERTAELAQASERAEAASRAKTGFLAHMSHEIRTPLNAITGLVRLLRDDDVTPRQRDRLARIDGAARHLLAVLNDILDLSKIEAGRFELAQQDFLLDTLVHEVREQIATPASERGLRLDVEVRPAGRWLRGDPTRLRQALLNYASNAVKFTDQGGISLRAAIEREEGGRCLLRLEVEDTGIGLGPAQLARLFQPFEQADSSASRRHAGTGLGLVITRRLAAMMDGEAGARSVPGQGSLFWMTAWLAPGQPVVTAPPRSPVEPLERLRARASGQRVLLAEDNAVSREVLCELLEAAGLVVDLATDGAQALERARTGGHALVLLDLRMPRLDGLDVAREVRATPGLARLPLVALSANAFEEDRLACAAAGMNAFVPKPVDPDLLYETLLGWLGDSAIEAPGEDVPAPSPIAPGPDEAVRRALQPLAQSGLLDLGRGLMLCSGQWALYRRVLSVFADTHAQDPAALRLAGTTDAARRARAHALKGACGAIGAVALAGRAQACQAAADGEVAGPAEALAAGLEALLAPLGAALAGCADPEAPAGEDTALAADGLLPLLRQGLCDGDPGVVVLAERSAGALRALLGEQTEPWLALVRRYDFDAALVLLQGRGLS